MDNTQRQQSTVRHYDDGPDWSVLAGDEKERAFRQGFVEEARRIVRQWPSLCINPPMKPVSLRQLMARWQCGPFKELNAAWHLRMRVRERYAVYASAYGPNCAGRRTYHLGYRPGHEAPAARLRGRHHALAYVTEPWCHMETSDVDIFDPELLGLWLKAVERWARMPDRSGMISPPPRFLEIAREATAGIPSC